MFGLIELSKVCGTIRHYNIIDNVRLVGCLSDTIDSTRLKEVDAELVLPTRVNKVDRYIYIHR